MIGTRISLALANADARQVAELAPIADRMNIGLWLGSPTGEGQHVDDSYVMVAAAAAAAVTTYIRLGVFMTLRGSATPLRIAEDLGVVDQASNGRIEAAFVMPQDGVKEWETQVKALLGAWSAWPTNTGRTVSATPGPCQPWLPRLVAGTDAAAIADRLRGGLVRTQDGPAAPTDSDSVPRRCVQLLDIDTDETGVRGWLSSDPVARIRSVRDLAHRSTADEVMIRLPGKVPTEDDIRVLAVGVAPVLRSAPHRTDNLALDAWNWLCEDSYFHSSPD